MNIWGTYSRREQLCIDEYGTNPASSDNRYFLFPRKVAGLLKVKLLKTNLLNFSLLKDAFKMNAKGDKNAPVYESAAVPCRTYWMLPLPSHRDQPWECQRQPATTAASPHLLLTPSGTCHKNSGMNSYFMVVYHHPSYTGQTKRQKTDVSLQVINWKTTGWAKVNFNSIQTGIHYPN